jgi:hypothetical protein
MLDASDSGNPAAPDYYLSVNPFVGNSQQVGYQFKTVSVVGGTNIPLTLSGNGNVGIGTTNPGSTLSVAGQVSAAGGMLTSQQGDLSMGQYTSGPTPN